MALILGTSGLACPHWYGDGDYSKLYINSIPLKARRSEREEPETQDGINIRVLINNVGIYGIH